MAEEGRSSDDEIDEVMSADSPATLRTLAEQCRRLARGASTAEVSLSLKEIAAGYENLAARADAKQERGPA